MLLTHEQDAAAKAFGEWLVAPASRRRPWFYLAGYAGTGKTTLARHLAEHSSGRVEFGAPTGKAAQVMKRAGCDGATTIHRLIYLAGEKSRAALRDLEKRLEALKTGATPINPRLQIELLERQIREERVRVDRPSFSVNPDAPLRGASLLVLDECSMVDERIARDVLSFGVPVLCLGDPAQLPPVRGGGFFTAGEPDAMLTEVRRQALDSPVLRLATAIRNGHPQALALGQVMDLRQLDEDPNAVDSRVIRFDALEASDCLAADVVLTGHNATRRRFNLRMRGIADARTQSLPTLPARGEPLIALNNRHDLGIYNGTILRAMTDARGAAGPNEIELEIRGDDVGRQPVTSSSHAFAAHFDPALPPFARERWRQRELVNLDWAYCLTVHKSQGSQWPSVVVADDGFLRSRPEDRRRWLYTAITRAERRVVVAIS
jgi:exodeoxyribonuclease-5